LVHLTVFDLDRSEDFYPNVLGRDVMPRWHGASFLSPGAPPPPPGAVRLRAFSITMSEEGLRELGIAPEQPSAFQLVLNMREFGSRELIMF
jgi:hypothetical protein